MFEFGDPIPSIDDEDLTLEKLQGCGKFHFRHFLVSLAYAGFPIWESVEEKERIFAEKDYSQFCARALEKVQEYKKSRPK